MASDRSRYEVIIIGAGAAGLAAAVRLSRAGRRTLILEARDRLGGRIHTLHRRGVPVPIELGPEFIHGRPEATWRHVRESGLVAYDAPFEHSLRRVDGVLKMDHYSEQLARAMQGLTHLQHDCTFADYLRARGRGRDRLSPIAAQMAKDFVEGFDAADTELVSAKAIGEEQEGLGDVGSESQFRLLAGYGALIEYFHSLLDLNRTKIVLNAPVSHIRWERGRVEVEVQDVSGRTRIFHAARAIITVPVGVLRLGPDAKGSVRFTPEVPTVRAAAERLGPGAVMKVTMVFREVIWDHHPFVRLAKDRETLQDAVFMHAPSQAFPTWWTMRPLRVPVLVGWAGGPRAVRLSGLSRREREGEAITSVAHVLGISKANIRSALLHLDCHDWLTDPYCRGAYSFEMVGGLTARKKLAAPVKGTLFFAGEAADTGGQASTVAGAIASGERAADLVLRV